MKLILFFVHLKGSTSFDGSKIDIGTFYYRARCNDNAVPNSCFDDTSERGRDGETFHSLLFKNSELIKAQNEITSVSDQFECKCVTINIRCWSFICSTESRSELYVVAGCAAVHFYAEYLIDVLQTFAYFPFTPNQLFLLSPVNCRSGRAENCIVENVLAIILN